MENNLENKAKFFALYYGQNVYRHNAWTKTRESIEVHGSSISNCAFGYLELNSLLFINDDDFRELAALFNRRGISPGWHSVDTRRPVLRIESKYPNNRLLFKYSDERNLLLFPDGSGIDFTLINSEDFGNVLSQSDYLMSVEFLRSKGYALPFMGFSVYELINYGWVKLKENA